MNGTAKVVSRAAGFRAEAERVSMAIVEGSQHAPRLVFRAVIEAARGAHVAEALASLRQQVLDQINAYEVSLVGVRFPESNARGLGEGIRKRYRVEGVLLEVAATQRLAVVCGSLKTIAAKLGTSKQRSLVEDSEFRGLSFDKIVAPMREAILVAVAALPGDD